MSSLCLYDLVVASLLPPCEPITSLSASLFVVVSAFEAACVSGPLLDVLEEAQLQRPPHSVQMRANRHDLVTPLEIAVNIS